MTAAAAPAMIVFMNVMKVEATIEKNVYEA
jgi:hypothetical protein